MAERIADISNYQVPSNGDIKGWLKALKTKYDVKSVCVLLSDGTSWKQPYGAQQVYNAYQVFGNFSAYHYFTGSGHAEAANFIDALKRVGADKSTVVMVDAETRVSNLTSHINAFIDDVYNAGYHNIYVYSMESMFNNNSDGIQVKKLHHSPKIWVANISYRPHMKFDAWQYTWTGKVQGINVDLDLDETGLLAHGPKVETITDKYYTSGKAFEALTDVRVYKEPSLQKGQETINYYTKGSRFQVDGIVYEGKYPRLKNKYGYITPNKKYVKKIK